MTNKSDATAFVMPFGKHARRPLADVPRDYLAWVLRTVKLSSGLRAAVAAELVRRGIQAPPPPPPPPAEKPLQSCGRCGSVEPPRLSWHEIADGRRQIRRTCPHCETFRGFAQQVPLNVAAADRNASPAPLLDVLTRLDELDIELISDGHEVSFTGDGRRRCPADLAELIRQCNHQLCGCCFEGGRRERQLATNSVRNPDACRPHRSRRQEARRPAGAAARGSGPRPLRPDSRPPRAHGPSAGGSGAEQGPACRRRRNLAMSHTDKAPAARSFASC